ncbi:DUF3237 domain-containing protein [Microbacterium sp. BH-3-3-3]|uniref:DUF3237 domain-containing protein n=1 Tax=Microbacterium sp. BH-3-3-3 TaxID=1906742 RepID=UPI0008927D14|nr:DUF3237 domain-containing protein [Microbacterium sp. BH-3-3-3]AOX45892.1 hypothetical protein BJP65_08785 [Microbacterium sp. BH-3-3-3]
MHSTPSLRPAFTVVARVDPAIPLERRGDDVLTFIPITGGPVSGDVEGEIVAGGGDWCLERADNSYDVEARYLIRTTDGDVIDVYNVGVVRPPEGDHEEYFLSTPRFRTVAPSLQWLTRSMFVGKAFSHADATTVEIFEVVS